MRALVLVSLLVGCGSSSPERAQPLELERISPPQFTSHDVFVGARGNIVVLAKRLSRDGGATWQTIDGRLGALDRVAIDGVVVATYSDGLVRWNLDTGTVTRIAGAPAFATDRTWRTRPGGRFMAFDQIENAIAFEGMNGWATSSLPQHSPTDTKPYIFDLASNGNVALVVSAWGVYRSTDGGASWQRILQPTDAGRVLVALQDGRFTLLGGATTYRFDASGTAAGTAPGITVERAEVAACSDGAVIARGAISRDAGATWTSLLGGGALELNVVRVSCGESYWVLGYSDSWGYRLLRYDPATATGTVAGNWELDGDSPWTSGGPPIVRDADGTFFTSGLAWREGEDTWTLRELPPRAWAMAGALHGFVGPQYVTSRDAGRTWTAPAQLSLDEGVEIEAFAATDDALLASVFTGGEAEGMDVWRSQVWMSIDAGATWSTRYDGVATRPLGGGDITGSAHRFVGVMPDGTWVAAGAISRDAGFTWEPTAIEGDRGLAFLTPRGDLVMTLPDEEVWRVYPDGGMGDAVATWALEAEETPVPASSVRSVAFDEAGYAYVARGAPYVQVWKTKIPVQE
ncbi:MAG: hypothetical protein SFX73_22345 [Kofleriaceae bacterium]|nr:hypothetical protein [Kofleriaceae bacterium]